MASVMMGVPTFYMRLLAEPTFDRGVASGVRLFVSGSAPLLPETFDAFEQRIGVRILERYGMTETGMNTSNPSRARGSVAPSVRRFRVCPCVSPTQRCACAPGEVGAVLVRGPNVFPGYWHMPEKTQEEFTADG